MQTACTYSTNGLNRTDSGKSPTPLPTQDQRQTRSKRPTTSIHATPEKWKKNKFVADSEESDDDDYIPEATNDAEPAKTDTTQSDTNRHTEGSRWSAQDKRKLRELKAKGMTMKKIATALGRNYNSAKGKWQYLSKRPAPPSESEEQEDTSWNIEDLRTFRVLYQQHRIYSDIATELKLSEEAVLSRMAYEMRQEPNRTKRAPGKIRNDAPMHNYPWYVNSILYILLLLCRPSNLYQARRLALMSLVCICVRCANLEKYQELS